MRKIPPTAGKLSFSTIAVKYIHLESWFCGSLVFKRVSLSSFLSVQYLPSQSSRNCPPLRTAFKTWHSVRCCFKTWNDSQHRYTIDVESWNMLQRRMSAHNRTTRSMFYWVGSWHRIFGCILYMARGTGSADMLQFVLSMKQCSGWAGAGGWKNTGNIAMWISLPFVG